jgi:uncharacterized membrane protein
MDGTSASSGISVPSRLHDAVEALERNESIESIFGPLERISAPVSSGRTGSMWRGDWLGHALHPMLTDLPLGCWLSAGLLDLFGGRGARRSAQRLIGLGLLAVPPTAASGMSDWSELREPRTRRVGAVHAVGNTVVALLYFRSWRARRRGRHVRGVAYGLLGGAGAMATGYLGGHLAYARRAGTGERGMEGHGFDGRDARPHGDQMAPARADDRPEELVDLTRASELIGVPVAQVHALVDEGLLDPVTREPDMRFRDSDVRALRLLGA